MVPKKFSTLKEETITDNMEELLAVLPPDIKEWLKGFPNLEDLLEVILDYGREVEARFPDSTVIWAERGKVTYEDIEWVVSRIGAFGKDNRAGINGTLHRISAIRNRDGKIIGLTLRVGRAVYGTIDIIRDVIETGKNILLLGRPGVGKTTKLREVARVLADEFHKRVIVVDTSNEIAGDGDVPHPAIGRARRMQVPSPELQHAVMIEAVENHMPEVIVIDEIGTEQEAYAARTIAERGVQLIATAHGNTLENLLLNPTLSDLVGGVQVVTLSDEESKRRGTQKTIMERKAPPTFDIVIEIMDMNKLAIHHDVAKTVDDMLKGIPPRPEIRMRNPEGKIEVLQTAEETAQPSPLPTRPKRIFPYGVSRNKLEKALRDFHLPALITKNIREADVILTLSAHQRKGRLGDAEKLGIPVYTVKSNTYSQIASKLKQIFQEEEMEAEEKALRETEQAIAHVLATGEPVELSPQNSYIRHLQHQLAQAYGLRSESSGVEPYRRVRIWKED